MVFLRKKKVRESVYLYVVSNKREGKQVKQTATYIGKEEELPLLLQNAPLARMLSEHELENVLYQIPVSLWNLMEQMQFRKIFSEYFSKEWGADAATVACVMILNYATDRRSKLRLHEWYAQTYLPHLLKIAPHKMNKDLLCSTMDFFTEENIWDIHAEIFKTANALYHFSDGHIFYDTTAVTFEGTKCPLAEHGYNSAHQYKLQVNIGLAITEERFPVMHKVFEGNTKDVSTLEKVFPLLEKTGAIEKTVFIMDRGIESQSNIDLIKSRKAQYIFGLPKRKNITKLITSLEETALTKIDDDLSYYETLQNEERLLIFWSKKLQDENRAFREKHLKKITEKLSTLAKNAHKYEKKKQRLYEKIGEICGSYRKFFEINTEHGFTFKLMQNKVDLANKTEGRYALLTNTNLAPADVLKKYRDRNFIEMSFKDLKLFINIGPLRHWKDRRVLAHIFLAVLALGLRSVVELKIRRAKLEMTSEEALLQLEKIRALVVNGKVLKLTGRTPETDKIVSALEG